MIQIGINKNVVLKNATIEPPKDGKGQAKLVLHLKEGVDSKVFNPFTDMNAATVIEDDTFQATMWPLKQPEIKDKKTGSPIAQSSRTESAVADITRLKNQLQQIVAIYLPADKTVWNVYDGTGLTQENYNEQVTEQGVLDIVYKNLVEQFISQVQPFFNKPEYAVRFKLVRQSKDKHYARIPDRYITENPFIELMTVPDAQSRVQFTKYEIAQGLDDATPVSKVSGSDMPGEATPEAGDVFGSR